MSKNITTHEEMMLEKKRLEALLEAQKELIELDLKGLKSDLKPASKAIAFVGSFKNKAASNPLLGIAVGLTTDILMRKLLLKRAGWAVKTVLPFVMRRVTTNLVSNSAKPGLLTKMVKKFT
ncbi:hypothetical protein ACX0G7_14290 [Flavitalea antarctica]